jgi:hypothetical protein
MDSAESLIVTAGQEALGSLADGSQISSVRHSLARRDTKHWAPIAPHNILVGWNRLTNKTSQRIPIEVLPYSFVEQRMSVVIKTNADANALIRSQRPRRKSITADVGMPHQRVELLSVTCRLPILDRCPNIRLISFAF